MMLTERHANLDQNRNELKLKSGNVAKPGSFKIRSDSNVAQKNVEKIERCKHGEYFVGKNTFCNKCGLYIIDGIETYREPCFEHSGKIDPNMEYNFMIKKQANNRLYNPKSISLKYRERLITYLRSKSSEYQFSSLTTYCSISYMDTVLSLFEVPVERLDLLAMCCLIIAAKFYESASDLESKKKLERAIKFAKDTHTSALVKKIEVTILNILEWNLDIQTPYHFVKFFLSKGVLFSTDTFPNSTQNILADQNMNADGNPLNTFTSQNKNSFVAKHKENMTLYRTRVAKGLRKYIQSISISALKDYTFYQYTALAVGASSIAVARIINNIKPAWPEQLINLSWIKFEDLETCTSKLLKLISHNQKLPISDSLLSNMNLSNPMMDSMNQPKNHENYNGPQQAHTQKKPFTQSNRNQPNQYSQNYQQQMGQKPMNKSHNTQFDMSDYLNRSQSQSQTQIGTDNSRSNVGHNLMRPGCGERVGSNYENKSGITDNCYAGNLSMNGNNSSSILAKRNISDHDNNMRTILSSEMPQKKSNNARNMI